MQKHSSPKPTKLPTGKPTRSGNPDDKFCTAYADKKVWYAGRHGQPPKSNIVPTKTTKGRTGHDRVFGKPKCTECGKECLFGRDKCDEHKEK